MATFLGFGSGVKSSSSSSKVAGSSPSTLLPLGPALQLHLNAPSSTLLLTLLALAVATLLYLVFVPPRRLQAVDNGVPVIRSRFGGLGAVGFYANRYQLCVRGRKTLVFIHFFTSDLHRIC